MKDEKKKKNLLIGDQKKITKKVDPKHKEEQENILFRTNEKSPGQKKINQSEIIQLQSGIPLSLSAYVKRNYVEHSVHFFKPFFYAFADVYGLERALMDKYVKPKCVPRFINRYIYGRFPNKVLNKIHCYNPLLSDFSRAYKNFQFLTIYADNLLQTYINDAIECLEESKSYAEFKIKFVQKFGVPNQIELFE